MILFKRKRVSLILNLLAATTSITHIYTMQIDGDEKEYQKFNHSSIPSPFTSQLPEHSCIAGALFRAQKPKLRLNALNSFEAISNEISEESSFDSSVFREESDLFEEEARGNRSNSDFERIRREKTKEKISYKVEKRKHSESTSSRKSPCDSIQEEDDDDDDEKEENNGIMRLKRLNFLNN